MVTGADDPAADLIRCLGLEPHPEGGHYRETFRAPAAPGQRPAVTAIYFLLRAGEKSRWHKVDAVEIWHWYAGAPLVLDIVADTRRNRAEDGAEDRTEDRAGAGTGTRRRVTLGPDISGGAAPQAVVPASAWQRAESLGAYTLVGCTVSPGFEFSGLVLAPPAWEPGG